MRRFSVAIPFLVTGVCLYFVVAFGREALDDLHVSDLGPGEQRFRAQRCTASDGSPVSGPTGLVQLAAFFGALKLAVAIVFALHLIDRFQPYREGEINHELLDAAALLAVCTTFIMAMPAHARILAATSRAASSGLVARRSGRDAEHDRAGC